MFTRFSKSIAASTLTAGMLGLAALISAGTAGAAGGTATADDIFLGRLAAHGFTPNSVPATIANGHGVCTGLQAGQSVNAVVSALGKKTGLSYDQANVVAIDAAVAYCPQYTKKK